jgi:hypothetical protein
MAVLAGQDIQIGGRRADRGECRHLPSHKPRQQPRKEPDAEHCPDRKPDKVRQRSERPRQQHRRRRVAVELEFRGRPNQRLLVPVKRLDIVGELCVTAFGQTGTGPEIVEIPPEMLAVCVGDARRHVRRHVPRQQDQRQHRERPPPAQHALAGQPRGEA